MERTAIGTLVKRQRVFFRSGATRPLEFRRAQLKALETALRRFEPELLRALKADLHKSAFEAYGTEVGFLLDEIKHALKELPRWMRPKRVPTPLVHFPASSRIYPEPKGVTLVVGPWNYPLQLLVAPAIGALAAGNCVVLKPSELAPHTSRALGKMVSSELDPAVLAVVEGGIAEAEGLLAERFDHIFFTGGAAVARIVMAAAVKNLTPVTLELGGKSPCVVAADAPIETTAKRIVWGKFLNAGQTCVAPDYLLVERGVRPRLLEEMKRCLIAFYGKDPSKSPDYGRIINERHFERLEGLLDESGGEVLWGGERRKAERYLAPTLVGNPRPDAKIMQEEIFGPLLPVLEYGQLDEAIEFVNERPRPLAFYVFSRDAVLQDRLLREVSFGGGCLNETLMHLASPHLPFGGVGESGMGAYHGEEGFRTFTHFKSVMRKSPTVDIPLRYPPHAESKLRLLKRILG